MDQQPKIPTLKDAQKPQVKIKGMGAGLTLFDRLKQFKKKDLAFILAGLGTLFMAPLAEHFMMAPENGDASLQQGWGKGGTGSNLFGSGSSPYESGNNNIASGGAIGGGGDIITPLNVRDPSALVMGPGSAQQPPAGSAAPAAPPPAAPASSETDYRDALKGAASRAASAAVKKAPLPVPKIAVGGSGLRGLGAAGGGTSASASLGPINSGNLGQAGTGGGGLGMVRTAPGFRGVAGARSPTGGTGLDNTKRAGANAGDAFNRAGSAAAGLNAAASEAIPTAGQGYGGGGAGGSGANDKPGSGTGPGGSKSVGESLAFIAAKERMMENMKLEFEKRKLKDPELLLYGIRNDILKASAAKIGEGLTTWGMCKGLSMGCPAPDDEFDCGVRGTMNASQMTRKCSGGGKDKETVGSDCWLIQGTQAMFQSSQPGGSYTCNATGKGKEGAGKPSTEGSGVDRVAAVRNLGGTCKLLNTVKAPVAAPAGAKPAAGGANPIDGYITGSMKPAAQSADIGRVILEGGAMDADCGATLPPDVKGNVVELIESAKAALSSAAPAPQTPPAANAPKGGVLQQMSALVAEGKDAEETKKLAAAFSTAETTLADAERLVGKAETAVATKLVAPDPKKDNGGTNIDSGVTTNVTSIQRAQAAVAEQAGTLKKTIADLKGKIASARTEIGDDKGTGSLHDTVRLNKVSPEIKVEAEAQAKLDSITASAPETLKTALGTTHSNLDKANKMLPIPIDPKTKKPDEGKKSLFETARKEADTALEASRKEQTSVIKGYSDFVDQLTVTKVLR